MNPNLSPGELFNLNKVALVLEMINTRTTKEVVLIAWAVDRQKILGEYSWKSEDGNPEKAAEDLNELVRLSKMYSAKEVSIRRLSRFLTDHGYDPIDDYQYIPIMKSGKYRSSRDHLMSYIEYFHRYMEEKGIILA